MIIHFITMFYSYTHLSRELEHWLRVISLVSFSLLKIEKISGETQDYYHREKLRKKVSEVGWWVEVSYNVTFLVTNPQRSESKVLSHQFSYPCL